MPSDLEAIDDNYEAFWVAIESTRDGDAVVGITGLERVGSRDVVIDTPDFIDISKITARLHHVMVVPERQRRGVGRQLIETATTWARTHYYEALILETTTEQEGAVAFYQSLGFTEIGRSMIGRWELVWFALDL